MKLSSALSIAAVFVLAGFFGVSEAKAGHCTAHTTCADGQEISCEGHSTCSRDSDSVTCDGETTSCDDGGSTCTASTTCPDGTFLSCEGQTCDGGGGLCYVQCDGSYQWCPGHEGEIFCVN